MILTGKQVKYRGTVTGLRISAVDGTAFIDNLPYTYRSDFSAGADSFTAIRGTSTGNIDGIGGEDNVLRFTCDTATGTHYTSRATVTIGKKYTVTFKYYIPSGQSNVVAIQTVAAYWGGVNTVYNVTDTWTEATQTFTANHTLIAFHAYATGATFQDAGGDDVFYIKDVTISEITPYMDGNHQIEIYDASNRMLRGVLKEAGTSETLDSELITNWTNSGFDTFTISGTDITEATQNDASSATVYQSGLTITTGMLLKSTISGYTLNSGVAPIFPISGSSGLTSGTNLISPVAVGSNYTTSPSNYCYLGYRVTNSSSFAASGNSVKQVLTPSSSGATIVSAKGGTTYNFAYKNTSFTYNAASYYCIVSKVR